MKKQNRRLSVCPNHSTTYNGNDVYTIKEDLKIGDEGGDEDFFFSLFSLKDTE
jgi:hypothetical protein